MLGALAGCGSDPEHCPRVDGEFIPLYTPLQTSCETLRNPNHVDFTTGAGASNINRRLRVNDDITTEVVMKGCTMRMTQTVNDKAGTLQQQIDGESLSIDSETQVSGQVTVTLFDPFGEPMCRGTYDAEFTKPGAVFGAGATGAGAGT